MNESFNKAPDHRNVIDHYKYWKVDAIRAELDTKRTPLIILAENIMQDFNLGTMIRNANAFVVREIHIVGRKKWDRRGAQGTYHYEHVHYHPDSDELISRLKTEGYRIVCVDNIEGSTNITEYAWPEKTVMIFGQEQIGVSQKAQDAADDLVYIPQLGSTRSLNVGTASGIMMYDYMLKTGQF